MGFQSDRCRRGVIKRHRTLMRLWNVLMSNLMSGWRKNTIARTPCTLAMSLITTGRATRIVLWPGHRLFLLRRRALHLLRPALTASAAKICVKVKANLKIRMNIEGNYGNDIENISRQEQKFSNDM
ncbi:hypothetical protein AVEN_270235-1 [Araneus ventricosus]|uniref:Uncharacterized protein n=1 Tax=Araneus ventricosus TaxID=182803 RepID=A0A4Y2A0D8_ARAVE|nr:hypothetical protein AVEN_270235-1 [Araneus ventricosus]